MPVWVVRAGRRGEGEEFALDQGMASIGFGLRVSVTEFVNRDALRDHLIGDVYRDSSANAAASAAGQLWNFAHAIGIGDMIVLPRKQPRVVAIGIVAGAYEYRPDLAISLGTPHVLAVGKFAIYRARTLIRT